LAQIGLVVIGLALLTLGARWLVDGAVVFAALMGVSELIIGLTVVAIGTSLPEIAASVVASLRGERDIAIGNVVGSCIFNILSVMGITSLLAPSGISVPQKENSSCIGTASPRRGGRFL
jgi:cation:H+ antiporter